MESIINKIFKSKSYGNFQVIEKIEKIKSGKKRCYYKVKFLDTGGIKISRRSQVLSGKVKDNYKPNTYDYGYVGHGSPKKYPKEYSYWRNMLSRCYNNKDEKYKVYGGNGVVVDSKWHNFGNFVDDVHSLQNWDKESFYNGEISLDKDIKQINVKAKIYSKDTCMWVESNKNYRYQPNQQNTFKAISPDGNIYYHFNMTDFCRFFPKLGFKTVSQVLHGHRPHHWGWKFEYIDKLPDGLTPLNINSQFDNIK